MTLEAWKDLTKYESFAVMQAVQDMIETKTPEEDLMEGRPKRARK